MLSKPYPHPEERPKGASRRTQGRHAALRLNSCPAAKRIPPLRSAPLARLEWLFVAADPSGRIEPLGHALTKRRMRPVCGIFHKTMLHRVEVGVVQVSRKVSIIADRVLPVPPLPNTAFATAGHGR